MAKIPLGMEYTTNLEGEAVVEFSCTKCRHAALALVRSKGEGSSTAWAFIGGDAAKQRSSEKAGDDLRQNAEVLAASAPCPKCGYADDSRTSDAHSKTLLQAFAVMGIGFFLAFTGKSFSLLFAGVTIAVAVVHYASSSWKWMDHGRVRFVTREELAGARNDAALQGVAHAHAWYLCWLWKADHDDVVAEPFQGTLRLGLLSRADDGNTWLEHSDLGSVSPDAALEKARENLEAASEASLREVEPGVWKGDWGDWFAATRLIIPQRFTALKLNGEPIAFTPSENTLFVAGSNDEQGLVRAATLAEAHAREVIANHPNAGAFCATPWRRTADVLESWVPPAGHPLRAQLEGLRALVGPKGWTPARSA